MKKTFLAALSFIAGLTMFAQSDDPVIMRINGQAVTRSEFEYSFNKNNADGVIDKKSLEDYVPMFVNFKLKVEAAKEAKLDTLKSIQKELKGYREQLVLPTIVDSAYIEREARNTYNRTAQRFGGEDLLTASHILVALKQNATQDEIKAAKVKIDSIYNVLVAGADFAEVAKVCSDDKASAVKGGTLGQFGKGMMIPDFEKAAYSLQKGEMSEPVLTTVGYHIIKVVDRHPFEPYEFHRANIIKFLEARGIKQVAANAYVDSVAKLDGLTREAEIDKLYDSLMRNDLDTRYLAQEYYDGTLMYEISKSTVWDKAAQDTKGLEEYFKDNKKKYKWDSPRFKGIVIHAKDEATLEEAKSLLKGVKEEMWARTLTDKFNNDSVKLVRLGKGVYKEGDNSYVDYLVFKKGEKKELKGFPYTDVYGNLLKKPRTYLDVKGQVTTDYQSKLEKEWIEELRNKYTVEIDESVLSTVNKH